MPSAGAVRCRRFRQRRRRGLAILPVEVDLFQVVDALIEAGAVAEDDSEDRVKVAAAVARIVHEWAKKIVTHSATAPRGNATVAHAQIIETRPVTAFHCRRDHVATAAPAGARASRS